LVPVARRDGEQGSRREEEKGRRGEEEKTPTPSPLLSFSPASNDSPHDIYALAGSSTAGSVEAGSAEADEWPGAQPNAAPVVSHADAAALWRSHQKPVSSLGSLGKAVAIVVGGFLGVAVAYLVLSIVSPSRFDFLHLWGRPGQRDVDRR
jgi:hypothetical protein